LKHLIKGSYVPNDCIQQLRQYDRRIFDLNKDIVYKLTKLDAALQRCNIRISNYVSTTNGKSYQIIRQLRDEVALANRHKDGCQSRMDELCGKWFPRQLANLKTIPGVRDRSATAIIAELGIDMSSFEDAAHLVSWCGLKPRNEESAGKIKSSYHQTVVRRKNKMKVKVAIARKMLTAIWFILQYNVPYRDFTPDITPAG
jgi:transposase